MKPAARAELLRMLRMLHTVTNHAGVARLLAAQTPAVAVSLCAELAADYLAADQGGEAAAWLHWCTGLPAYLAKLGPTPRPRWQPKGAP